MTKKVEMGRAPRILLIEDNRGDVLLLRRAIAHAQANLELTVAQTAEEAIVLLQAAAASSAGVLPDLIITDLNLPGMYGVDFLRMLKTDPSFKRIPCVVLTSSSGKAEIESAYDAYANGFLTKPSSSDGYLHMVAELTAYWFALVHTPHASMSDILPSGRNRPATTDATTELNSYSVRTPHAPVPQVTPHPQETPMTVVPVSSRILVVEDEADIRDLLQIVLTSKGYEVATAEDGRDGLDQLGRFTPDLILLDLAMPELDGIGFLTGKSHMPDVRHVPVIVLSARDKNADVMRAIEMGADTYITKPFDTEIVLASIERLLAAVRDAIVR